MQKKKEKKETQSCLSVTWSKASSTDVVCHQLVYQCVIRVKLCGYVTYTQKAGTQRGRDTGKHTLGHLPSLCRNAGTERKMLLIRENIPGVSVVEANDANARLSSTRRVQWRRRRRQQCKQCMWSDFMCSVQRDALRSRFCFVSSSFSLVFLHRIFLIFNHKRSFSSVLLMHYDSYFTIIEIWPFLLTFLTLDNVKKVNHTFMTV